MNYLYRYVARVSVFIVLVLITTIFLYPSIKRAFVHNIPLNSFILITMLFGVFWVLLKLKRLIKEQKWLDAVKEGKERFPGSQMPVILIPLYNLLSDTKQGFISQFSLKMSLSSIEQRLDETRDIGRYIMEMLIFLGLLGTFWGLSQTITSIATVISGVDLQSVEVREAFSTLKNGLQSPLVGMGTAFSSSMFGIVGAVIIKFLDLQYGSACGRLYNYIEEMVTYYNKPSGLAEEGSGSAYSSSLLEQTIEGMATLSQQMKHSEENRLSLVKNLTLFSEKLSSLTEHINNNQIIVKKISQNQLEIQEVLLKISKGNNQQEEVLRQHLRNIDHTAVRLLEETIEGRAKIIADLRNDIRLIARTLSSLANQDAA